MFKADRGGPHPNADGGPQPNLVDYTQAGEFSTKPLVGRTATIIEMLSSPVLFRPDHAQTAH